MKSQLFYNVFASLVCLMVGALPASAQEIAKTDPTARPQVIESYGKLPLTFEANQGQTDRSVKFLSRGSGYTLFLTEDSAVLSLHGKEANAALRMKLLGAKGHAKIAGADGLPGKSNYFAGNDPKQWHTNVPTYASVKYTGVYPGIDLVYHGNQRLLEYDFVVAPGADPRVIDLRFEGTKKLSVNREGALVLGIGDSEVIEHAPVVYQDIGGQRKIVSGRYVMRGKSRVGFSVAAYDRSRSLVIDPTLEYSTFLGGNWQDIANSIAADASGNAYVTGWTGSVNFPITPGAFLTTSNGGNAFVTKLSPSGSTVIYSTYLLGDYYGMGSAIAVDAWGQVYITGLTESSNFPTTPGAFQVKLRGQRNAFVTKLNATGSGLIFSTYLGGSRWDEGRGIAIDSLGDTYVTGYTQSLDFPTTPGAFQNALGRSGGGAFVSKLNAAGSALVYSTCLGSLGNTSGSSIVVDIAGNAFVTGAAASRFPTTSNAFKKTIPDYSESAFVVKLNALGTALVYSTYVPDSYRASYGNSVQIDASGNAYIAGSAYGPGFLTSVGALQQTYGGGDADAFVCKLNATGSSLVASTYLGGSGHDEGTGISVDASGVYVTGFTSSVDFPTSSDAFQRIFGGSYGDAFISKLDADMSTLIYSTYLGGNGGDSAWSIAADASGNVFVAGVTASSNFHTTPGAFQTMYGGGILDMFVTKLNRTNSALGPTTTLVLNGPTGSDGWYLGPVTLRLNANGPDSLVSTTYYAVDSGPFARYSCPFPIAGDGVHSIVFYSTDNAGRQESPHGRMIGIDATKPVSHITALPVTEISPNFSLGWSGADTASGVSDYSIYVSDNGGPFNSLINQTTANQAWFTGSLGHTYRFYCSARDLAGNVELKKVADAITSVPAQMPADANGDGQINCADLAIVKSSMGKSTGQTGFDPRADVNHDGVVNVLDLAIVSQKLIPGTTCP